MYWVKRISFCKKISEFIKFKKVNVKGKYLKKLYMYVKFSEGGYE